MKKETILLLALLVGVGGYRYWQSQKEKQKSIPEPEPFQSIYEILKAIEKEAEDSSSAIKKVQEVFKIESNDANKTWELYQMNKETTPEAFNEILKQNGLMD